MENKQDILGVKFGNESVLKIMLGDVQIWPSYYFNVTPSGYDGLEASSQNVNFSFITNYTSWSASTDQTWAQVTYFSGGTLTVHLDYNFDGYLRETYITILIDGNYYTDLVITQQSQ